MELKVMIVGRNRQVARDLSQRLQEDRGYTIIKCPPSKHAIFELALSEMPHIVIICAARETMETIKVYDVLRESARTGAIEIIVISNNEDKELIMSKSKLDKILFIGRPVPMATLYRKLDEYELKIENNEVKDYLIMQEFINPETKAEFRRKHILVVDDDPDFLLNVKDHLTEFYEVSLLNGGKNVFNFLRKYKVDLILLDYDMPVMNGEEVFTRLKDNPDFAHIPVVFLTGISEKDIVFKTLTELRPEGYLLKPFKKSEVVATIIDTLG